MRSRILLASIFALTLLALTHFALIWGNDSSSSSLSIPLHGGLDGSAVQQSDYVLSASPASLTGASASFAVRVPSCGGISEPVVLTVQGLPAGTTFSFNPEVVQPPANGIANSTLALVVAPTAPVGSYPLNVTATYPDLVRWTRVVLNVLFDTGDVSINVSPQTLSIGRGGYGTATVKATSIGHFSSGLLLSVSGLPADVTVAFDPPIVTPLPGGIAHSTIRISVSNGAMLGTYPLTVVASNETLTRSVSMAFMVVGENWPQPVAPTGLAFAIKGIGAGVAAAPEGLLSLCRVNKVVKSWFMVVTTIVGSIGFLCCISKDDYGVRFIKHTYGWSRPHRMAS